VRVIRCWRIRYHRLGRYGPTRNRVSRNALSPVNNRISTLPLMVLPLNSLLASERPRLRECSLGGTMRIFPRCCIRYHRLGVDGPTRDHVSRCALSAVTTRISRTSQQVLPSGLRTCSEMAYPSECSLAGWQSIVPIPSYQVVPLMCSLTNGLKRSENCSLTSC
jgi:hypothetical protein